MRKIILAVAAMLSVPAQAADYVTVRTGFACVSFDGASDAPRFLMQKPAGVKVADWMQNIGCLPLPGDLNVVATESIGGVTRGYLVSKEGGKTVPAYFPIGSIWNPKTGALHP